MTTAIGPRIPACRWLVVSLGCCLAAASLFGCGGGGSDGGATAVVASLRGDTIALLPYLERAGASPELSVGKKVSVLEIDFADDGIEYVRRATAASKLVRDVEVREEDLHFGAEGDGNRLAWECDLDASEVTHVLIEKLATADTRGPVHLLWQGPDQGPEQWYHAAFSSPVDGAPHDALIPVEDSPGWHGKIERMALQFGVPQKKTIGGGAVPIRLTGITYSWMDLGKRREEEDRPGRIRRAVIQRESRDVVHAPAPSSYAVDLEVPAAARLDFGIAVHPSNANKKGDGVEFRVTFRGEGDAEDRVLFERAVDVRRPDQRGWMDLSLDLGELAGKRGTLTFHTDPLEQTGYDDALWAHPTVYQAREVGPPNILMVSLDTVRADHLGCYGYTSATAADVPTTPAIDAFAARSLLFEQAFAAAPETVASHMSLFTSLYPDAHGIEQIYDQLMLSDKVPLLAELLREQESPYATAAFTEGGGLHYSVGFDRGFDRYSIGEIQPDRPQKMLESTFRNATRWLENNAHRRFFLFVHSYEAHTPYDPPAPYDTMFYPDYDGEIAPPISAGKVEELVIGRKIRYGGDGVKRIVSLYDGALRYLDQHVGELLAKVESLGLLEDTIVILFSDHGEDFFDHFSVATHGHSLYEEMVHIPLIIRIPGTGNRGARIAHPVSLVDLMPTLLALTGGEKPSEMQGVSRMPLIQGKTMEESPIYMEDNTGIRRAAIRIGDMKRILSPDIQSNPILELIRRFDDVIRLDRFEGILQEVEVYNLKDDPGELRNLHLGGDRPVYLRDRLCAQCRENQERVKARPPVAGAMLDSDTATRLDDLGYTEDDDSKSERDCGCKDEGEQK